MEDLSAKLQLLLRAEAVVLRLQWRRLSVQGALIGAALVLLTLMTILLNLAAYIYLNERMSAHLAALTMGLVNGGLAGVLLLLARRVGPETRSKSQKNCAIWLGSSCRATPISLAQHLHSALECRGVSFVVDNLGRQRAWSAAMGTAAARGAAHAKAATPTSVNDRAGRRSRFWSAMTCHRFPSLLRPKARQRCAIPPRAAKKKAATSRRTPKVAHVRP